MGSVIGVDPVLGQQAANSAPPAATASAVAESYKIEELIMQYRIQEDGSGTRHVHTSVLIRDQAGVTAWSTLVLPYRAGIEKLAVDRLILEKPGGRQVTADALRLEDVAVSGQVDTPILDDVRAKKLAVPALEAGDRLIYDVTCTRSVSLIPGHFWIDHRFMGADAVVKETLEIDVPSSRTLSLRVRRGDGGLVPDASPGRRVYRWITQASSPPSPAQDSRKTASVDAAVEEPDVRVSSFTDWNQLAAWFADVVNQRSEPDAAIKARAIALTQGIEAPEEKLKALYAFVSTQIRYISLAFGAGRLEPRAAGLVLSTQYGDCKDKHVLLASLARAVGIRIEPVLISTSMPLDEQVPSPTQFDHVISVRISPDSAQWLWMDSTSGVLPAGALFPMLRNKRALLIATGHASDAKGSAHAGSHGDVVTTPAALPAPSVGTVDIAGTIDDHGILTARVTRHLTGDLEYLLRLAFRDASQQVKLDAAKVQAKEDGLREPTVKDATFTDQGAGRSLEFAYEATHAFALQYGKAWQIWIPTPSLGEPLTSATKRPVPMPIALDLTVRARYEVPAVVHAHPPVPVSVEREFASYQSTYRVEGRVLSLERRIRLFGRDVPESQLASYEAFLRAVDADYRQTFAVDPIAGTAPEPSTADELNHAGTEAIDTRDYQRAITLLARATALDPQHKYAWNNLGRAYNGIRDYQHAKEALERQIAVNPFDEYAYTNLGNALLGLHRPEEAIAQYKKQIEIVPLDKYAHAALGRIYARLYRYDEALAALERAVTVSPEDGMAWQTLGQVRLEKGQREDAIKAFMRAVELSPTAPTWNNAAWALAEKGVKLDVAERYARSAVDATAKLLNDATLNQVRAQHLAAVAVLPMYWDTLGWVHFKAGNLASAERWLRAAWALGQNAETGEHLAMVLEKLGKRDQAIAQYAQALAASSQRPASRAALERLIGPGIDRQVREAQTALLAQRSIALPPLGAGSAHADVNLLVAPDGRITSLQFVKGDARLRAHLTGVTGLKTSVVQPDGEAVSLVRQGVVGCSTASGCTLILLRPTDVAEPPPGR